jgi:hypothetical protein
MVGADFLRRHIALL